MNHFEKISVPLAIVVLLGIQIQCERAHADVRDGADLRSIFAATSIAELGRNSPARAANADLARERALCSSQIELKIVPVSCFDVLARESSLGLINDRRRAQSERFLNDLCVRAAKASRVPLHADSKSLSENCRTAMNTKTDDIEYTRSEKDPASVFRQRF
jgi:hypothetical protein